MKALLFDTETTGLIENRAIALDNQPEVIEYYACLADLKKGKVLSEYDTLIRPKRPVNGLMATNAKKTITDITGIDDKMLEKAPTFEKVADKIKKQIESAPVVIGQNVEFDREMMNIEFERLGQKIKWPPCICTIEQTIHLKGERLNLSRMHELLTGVTFPGAHRAKADTLALMRCATALVKRGLL
jgi:DNA polymerase-3 subunit epsilon